MKNRYFYLFSKHSIYLIILCLSYIISASPSINGLRPILVLPAVVAIAIYENELAGGVYGALAGLLLDYGAMTIFGINSMLLLILGCASGLISLYWFQSSLKSALIQTTAVSLIQGAVAHFLLYGMWRIPDSNVLLYTVFLPTALLCALVSPLYYFMIRNIYNHFEPLCRPAEET